MTIATKVLAAEVVAGPVTTLVANTLQVSNTTVANGNVFRVSVAGTTFPGAFGSSTYPTGAVITVTGGANGNIQDATIFTMGIPASQNPAFAAEFLMTCKGNAISQGSNSSNQVWSIASFDPYAVISSPSGNGNVNVMMSTTNTANISLYVSATSGQGANVLVEQMIITQVW